MNNTNMSSNWQEWVQKWVSKEVLGVQCGKFIRRRTIKVGPTKGGNPCEKQYKCSSDCYEETNNKVCPGMYHLDNMCAYFV